MVQPRRQVGWERRKSGLAGRAQPGLSREKGAGQRCPARCSRGHAGIPSRAKRADQGSERSSPCRSERLQRHQRRTGPGIRPHQRSWQARRWGYARPDQPSEERSVAGEPGRGELCAKGLRRRARPGAPGEGSRHQDGSKGGGPCTAGLRRLAQSAGPGQGSRQQDGSKSGEPCTEGLQPRAPLGRSGKRGGRWRGPDRGRLCQKDLRPYEQVGAQETWHSGPSGGRSAHTLREHSGSSPGRPGKDRLFQAVI